MTQRNYQRIRLDIPLDADRDTRLRLTVDALWEALASHDVSWIGFYLHEGGDELILGPSRDTPACSPIGLHGVCGQAFLRREPVVIDDVLALGAAYIACNPRDRAEVVVPLLDGTGACWAVLDVDSCSVGAFTQDDVRGLTDVLQRAGLA